MSDYSEDAKKLRTQALSIPLLSLEEEKELGRRLVESHGEDDDALQRLIKPHMRMVYKQAQKFKNYNVSLNDLICEGNVGLVYAAKKFNPEKGARFGTYAGWWILSLMTDFILKNYSIVHIGNSKNQKTLFFNLRRLIEKINKDDDTLNQNTLKTISKNLNIKEKDIITMYQKLVHRTESLNTPSNPDNETSRSWIDNVSDEKEQIDEVLQKKEMHSIHKKILEDALKTLDSRTEYILRHRFLLQKRETLEVLADHFNVSRERIRQLEKSGYKTIQKFLKDKGLKIHEIL